MSTMLFVQVIGFPIVFLIRAIIHTFRFVRGPEQDRRLEALQVGSNVCFALTSVVFTLYHVVGRIFGTTIFVTGITLLTLSFITRFHTARIKKNEAGSVKSISIRRSKLSKRPRASLNS